MCVGNFKYLRYEQFYFAIIEIVFWPIWRMRLLSRFQTQTLNGRTVGDSIWKAVEWSWFGKTSLIAREDCGPKVIAEDDDNLFFTWMWNIDGVNTVEPKLILLWVWPNKRIAGFINEHKGHHNYNRITFFFLYWDLPTEILLALFHDICKETARSSLIFDVLLLLHILVTLCWES